MIPIYRQYTIAVKSPHLNSHMSLYGLASPQLIIKIFCRQNSNQLAELQLSYGN